MRYIKYIFGIILTAACIAFGIFLPKVVFSMEDNKVINSSESHKVVAAKLTYTSTLFDVLSNIESKQYTIEYSDKDTQLSRSDVRDITKDFIERIDWLYVGSTREDLESMQFEANPFLMIIGPFGDSDVAAGETVGVDNFDELVNDRQVTVIWTIKASLKDNSVELLIDDKSKKVVSFMVTPYSYEKYKTDNYNYDYNYYEMVEKSTEYVLKKLIPSLEEYYNVSIQGESYDDGTVILEMKDEDNNTIKVIADGMYGIHFNSYYY